LIWFDKYEFIIIDSPAGIDEGFQTAITSANEALVIVTPEVPSIRDADKVIGILLAQGIKNNKLIINRIRPKMVKSDDMMSISDVKNILGIPILGVIPDSEQVIIASNRGEPLVLEDNLSIPGLAFENTARRLNGEKIEFLDLDNVNQKNSVRKIIGNFLNRKNQNN
jgi:septum site-determining protein MinD